MGVVGLDVGSDALSVCVLAADGRELCRRWSGSSRVSEGE